MSEGTSVFAESCVSGMEMVRHTTAATTSQFSVPIYSTNLGSRRRETDALDVSYTTGPVPPAAGNEGLPYFLPRPLNKALASNSLPCQGYIKLTLVF